MTVCVVGMKRNATYTMKNTSKKLIIVLSPHSD